MTGPQAYILPDGRRLHLQHGPIDLIIEVFGPERNACYARATERFQTILAGLAGELDQLRKPLQARSRFSDPVARRMAEAAAPFESVFVTPMAAVAGAVADEVLAAIRREPDLPKTYVNNGGDIAFHLPSSEQLVAEGAAGEILIPATSPARGLATSGWRGRSHSLGIADAVTVAAPTAAAADVAATLIANAVDLPGHPAITRQPARALSPESDLGDRLVTTRVPSLPAAAVETALANGLAMARTLQARGLISQVALSMQGQCLTLSPASEIPKTGALAHA